MAISPNIGEAFARVGDAALAEIRPRRSGGGGSFFRWFRMETPKINWMRTRGSPSLGNLHMDLMDL